MQFAPSTYYAHKSRPTCKRKLTDAQLKVEIARVHRQHRSLYGAEKVWQELWRQGIACGRDRVARLMAELGLCGVTRRRRPPRTTTPATEPAPERPADHVKRDFSARTVNRLWVVDITYVCTKNGFCYVAFVVDVFSRRVVGWAVSTRLDTSLPLAALEMAICTRRAFLDGLVHHSDRGSQYTSIRYSKRLEEAGIRASVGSKGDSFDNALVESFNGLYKTELIWRKRSWRDALEVELATGDYIDWWNNERIHSALGFLAPAEYEKAAAAQHDAEKPDEHGDDASAA